ncbi:hypothetical protein TSUD_413730 [Trifolium subterraneum]|uniref:Uncharacterized protein n=1 Tax=Trifolium subterraneum TaxID=3900 RepID=A0A2Z6P6V2_TRISU|nr:hypothetical protein TSUD_413730 [Trifolium subterraneum]
MDLRSGMDKDIEVDLESGLPLIEDNSSRISDPSTATQENTLFANIPFGFAGGEDGANSYFNESNLSEVSLDVMKVINNNPGKEKRKKASSNKKAGKPPRPPKGPTLDAADIKLIRELSERALLKRARVERMKALKKMRAAKSSSASNTSSILALIFTIIFFIVIIFQGLSPTKSPVASFQGSPVSEEALISVQYQLNPSSDSNAPGSEALNFVQRVAGSDFDEKWRRDYG